MKQYVLYDKETGEVRHVHQVISAEKDGPVQVDDEQLAAFVERMVDPETTAWLYAEVPATSSRAAARHVDTKRRRLVTKRIPAREQERIRRVEG
jgi:hypothetical protein